MDDIISKLKKPLDISDVDFRIQSINNGGYATVLAYKDARVDMNRLDEVCGTNWQKDYKTIESNLYCGVGIKIENEWLWRWDVGTESYSDKEKGQASDAFKRACFNWGIGRELYNYPFIQVKLNPDEYTSDNGKVKQSFKLKLSEWKWNVVVDEKGNVTSLNATDEKGVLRYSYPTTNTQQSEPKASAQPTAEKPWLNKMDGKNMHKDWLAIVKRITDKSISKEKQIDSIEIIKQHYRLSKENETELTNLIKSVNNGSNQ